MADEMEEAEQRVSSLKRELGETQNKLDFFGKRQKRERSYHPLQQTES